MLNEPRSSVFRHVNLLVPPKHPDADMGFIIMEPEFDPLMSGSNSICISTMLLDSGIIERQEPETRLTREAPGELIRVRATYRIGKAERVFLQNLPSFAEKIAVPTTKSDMPRRASAGTVPSSDFSIFGAIFPSILPDRIVSEHFNSGLANVTGNHTIGRYRAFGQWPPHPPRSTRHQWG